MQDLLLAQKRDRPAYCFQHLDLELRSHDNGCGANLAAANATLAPWPDVVARFKPEWNSLGVNKTRSFNILGEFMIPDAQFCCIRSGNANSPTATLRTRK
jgi:glutathione S-transferase